MELGRCRIPKCFGLIKALNEKLSAIKTGACNECGRLQQVSLL